MTAFFLTHVIPIGNGEPVHSASEKCFCSPLKQGNEVIHHSRDNRELYERNEKPIPNADWVLVHEIIMIDLK